MAKQRYRLVSDDDGHDYVIAAEERPAFDAWIEAVSNDDYSKRGFDDQRLGMHISNYTFTDLQEDK